MNRYRFLFLLVVIVGLFTNGCKNINSGEASLGEVNKKTKILTSFYPMYILSTNLIKDIPDVELQNLANSSTGCLHDYNLTSNDMKALEQADVFIINGMGMESFMEKVAETYPNLKIIEASKGAYSISENGIQNPHIWVSVSGAIEEVRNISDGLVNFNSKNKEKYNKNLSEYITKLEALKLKMNEKLKPLEGSNIVTFHEAFPYFAKEFGFNIVSVIESEPGVEPSPLKIKETIKIVKEKSAKALFVEPQYLPGSAKTIAEDTKVKIYSLDPVVTPRDEYRPEEAYEKVMEENMNVLVEALK